MQHNLCVSLLASGGSYPNVGLAEQSVTVKTWLRYTFILNPADQSPFFPPTSSIVFWRVLTRKIGNWIVPVLHGTNIDSAMSICQQGFAALGKTDGGWYGKGIYFTTYACNTLHYLKA